MYGLAQGMGLNAFYLHSGWRDGLLAGSGTWCCVFSRCFIFIMSITKLRGWMISSIPMNLESQWVLSGLFIGLIGLKNGGIIVGNQATITWRIFPNDTSGCDRFLIISILSLEK